MSLEYAPRGLVGVLTPQANTTVEPELAILWPAGVAMVNARMTSGLPTIAERLVDYYERIDASLAQFANAPLSAVAIACTGASYLVGRAREDAMIARLADRLGVPVVTTAMAVVDALNASGAARIGLVSPYPADLTEASVGYWRSRGFEVATVVSAALDETAFHPIYAMRAAGAREALDGLAGEGLDAVVMLGTGMPTLRPILERPRAGGARVMSCMLCLAWRTIEHLDGRTPSAAMLDAWIAGEDWRARFADRQGR